MKDKLKAAHEKLQNAVAEIVSGEDWQRMLKVASKFHNYSFNNQLMIFLQWPDATHVAGFNRWKSLGRFVKKGEKGIAIFAPCKYRQKDQSSNDDHSPTPSDLGSSSVSDNGKAKHVIRGFRVVHVFDTLSRDFQDCSGGGRLGLVAAQRSAGRARDSWGWIQRRKAMAQPLERTRFSRKTAVMRTSTIPMKISAPFIHVSISLLRFIEVSSKRDREPGSPPPSRSRIGPGRRISKPTGPYQSGVDCVLLFYLQEGFTTM